MQKLIEILRDADREIKKNHRYSCGLEPEAAAGELQSNTGINEAGTRARFFFSSPDGQNGELYYALRKRGLLHSKYVAEYFWAVREKGTNWIISYTEGDVDIYQEKPICADRLCKDESHKHSWMKNEKAI